MQVSFWIKWGGTNYEYENRNSYLKRKNFNLHLRGGNRRLYQADFFEERLAIQYKQIKNLHLQSILWHTSAEMGSPCYVWFVWCWYRYHYHHTNEKTVTDNLRWVLVAGPAAREHSSLKLGSKGEGCASVPGLGLGHHQFCCYEILAN